MCDSGAEVLLAVPIGQSPSHQASGQKGAESIDGQPRVLMGKDGAWFTPWTLGQGSQ